MKIFNSIHTCPIYNYFDGVEDKNDLRYLLVLDDYSELPAEGLEYSNLQKAYEKINNEFEPDTLNLEIKRLEMDAWNQFLIWKLNPEKDQKYNTAFAKYRSKLESKCKHFVITDNTITKMYYEFALEGEDQDKTELISRLLPYKGVLFKSINNIIEELKKIMSFDEVKDIRLYLTESIEYEMDGKRNLTEQIANIELIFDGKITIDRMKDSISKLMIWDKKANEKIKSIKHENFKKQNSASR